jgi:hypothetical protein
MAKYKMSITIPKELRERMDRLSGVNWSEVAEAAFEERLTGKLKLDSLDPELPTVIGKLVLEVIKDQLEPESETSVKRLG